MGEVIKFVTRQGLVGEVREVRTRSGNIHWDMTQPRKPWYDADDVWAGRQEGLDAR